MGSRANVAVRENGEWAHCGSNGMGYSLDAWLAPGPAPALAVVRSFPVWERDEWQTESVCEAGALIDLDGKNLLVFLSAGYAERLACLDGYRRTWPGWTVKWTYNGIADVTDALGLDLTVPGREPWDNTELFRWGGPDADEPLAHHPGRPDRMGTNRRPDPTLRRRRVRSPSLRSLTQTHRRATTGRGHPTTMVSHADPPK